ncbi:hypothetical protein [Actinacidiphila soli]|uniref:hypothetical protein n=1 Tax=Actinacidiphila soli TaxID=2487275 RepID=UPI003898EA8A
MQLTQRGPWEPVEERGKEGAVRRGDARPVDLPLQDGQLVADDAYWFVSNFSA